MGLSVDYLAARFTAARWLLTGRVMRPFCLDYLEQLEAIDSPCIRHGQVMTLDDLRAAANICSAPIGTGYLRVYRPLSWLAWRITRRLYSLPLEQRRWEAYLADNYTTPRVWTKPDKGAPRLVSTPWSLSIELRLLSAGYPYSRVRSMPLGLAVHIALAISESEGGARVMSEAEASILETLKAARREQQESSPCSAAS